jgi:hypothetical protein
MASKRPVDDNQRLWRRASVAPTAAATTSRNRTLPIEKKEKEKSSSSCPVAVGRFFCFLFFFRLFSGTRVAAEILVKLASSSSSSLSLIFSRRSSRFSL